MTEGGGRHGGGLVLAAPRSDGTPRLGPDLLRAIVGIALVAPDGRWIDVNPALCEILGYTRDELFGRGWQDVTPSEDVPPQLALVAELRAGRTQGFRNRKRYIRKDGRIVHADLSVTALGDGLGGHYNLAQIVDVTDREEALAALADSEATLERAEAAAHVGHWTWVPAAAGASGTASVPVWSPEAYRILGLAPAGPALDLDSMTDLLTPGSLARSFAAIESVLTDHQPYAVEIEFDRPDGSHGWAEIRGAPELAPDGTVTRLVGVLIDITARKLAELSVASSADELAEAQRVARVGSYTWDVGTGELGWSDEMYRLYGREPGSVVPRRAETLAQMRPEEYEELNDAVARAVRDGEPYEVEYELRGLDGVDRRVLARGQVETAASGAITGVRGTVADITDLAEARAALAESEARYRQLVENTGDIVFRSTTEAVIEWISPSVETLLGYRADEFVGRRIAELVHPDDATVFAATASRVNGGDRVSYEARFRCSDGSWRWCWVVAAPIHDAAGTVIGRTGVVRDIDELRRTRQALETAAAELGEAQRLAQVGSWTWDPRTDAVEWSDELFRIVGRDPVAGAPSTAAQGEMYEPADYERLLGLLERTVRTGEPYETELAIRRPDGSTRTTIAHGEATRGDDGTVVLLRGTLVDVTDQQERREARARHVADRAEYLASAEHTLRTHLTVVEGWADAIAETADSMDPDTLRRAAAAIGRNAASLTRLMHALMVEAGESARAEGLEAVPVDVAAIAARVAEEYHGIASVRSLSVTPGTGIRAMGSEDAVATVVGHLVENALKFTGGDGSIAVEIGRRRGAVELSVTDDGPGLPEGLRVFDAFAHSGPSAGHGLGLHVVRTLVEAMGGSVRTEPRPDGHRGARFVVTLRAA